MSAQAQQSFAVQQNAAASMLDTVFRLTLAATQHAQHVVLPGVESKIAEMQDLLAKEANLAEREKSLLESKDAQIIEKEKHAGTVKAFAAEKQKWKTDCENEERTHQDLLVRAANLAEREKSLLQSKNEQIAEKEKLVVAARAVEALKQKWKTDCENEERTREQQRYARYVAAEQLMLPSALRTEDARALVNQLIPVLEGTREGLRLRAALIGVALAEIGTEDDDFMRAVQDLFQPASAFDPADDLPGHLKRLLSNHGKDPIVIEIPAPGEAYNPATMATQNPELTAGRPIVSVLKWGVKMPSKERRKRAFVA